METPEHNTEQSANSEELVSLIKAQLQEKDNQIERLQQLLAIEKDQTQQLLERQLLP
jgi:ferritin-like metal-binding protein YciE